MNFRLASENDINEICLLIESAIQEMEKHEIFQWDNVYPTESDFLKDIEKDNLFVGEEDDNISVVYAINKDYDEQYSNGKWMYPESDFRIIHRLCVNPAYQNKGVAKRTLEHIESSLRDNGVESIRLDVFTENPFALSLYRKCGYDEVGTTQWRKGKFLLMEKKL